MQRRSFIKNAAFSAVTVSASGFVIFDGKKYVGDCETTSDIIGPFYRPDSPVRNNFVIEGEPGTLVELSGIIKHNDCTTPYKKAKIELWHCNNKGLYDNDSSEYRYRGTTFSDEEGRYSFNTILPVAYNAAGGPFRPAHFHLMITAEGYQPLITQLYFTGDPYIDKDPYSNSPTAKRRILEVQDGLNGKKEVLYGVSMAEKLNAELPAMDKLIGNYINEDDNSITCEFFIKNKSLWYNAVFGKKLDPFGRKLEYIGNNTFQSPSLPSPISNIYVFEIKGTGAVKCTETFINQKGQKFVLVYTKGK